MPRSGITTDTKISSKIKKIEKPSKKRRRNYDEKKMKEVLHSNVEKVDINNPCYESDAENGSSNEEVHRDVSCFCLFDKAHLFRITEA